MSDERVNLSAQPAAPQPPIDVVPTDVVPLPSRGLVYPAGHPLHNISRVEIKSMTAKEEDILTSRALMRTGKTMSTLIRSCLMNRDVDPDDLLSGDRNAILTAIRITGYGKEYDVDVDCPNCGKTSRHSFDLSKLPIKELEESPPKLGENAYEMDLPISKKKVVFKLPTGSSEREADSEIEESVKKLGPAAEAAVTTRIFHHVISLGGETDRAKLRRLVGNMPAGDARALRKRLDKLSPGVDMTQNFECGHCGNKAEVDVPMGTEFFWPSNG